MSQVSVQKIRESNASSPLLPDTVDLLDGVRRRAYELFERRGGAPGNDMQDWLQAEQEVFQIPPMELSENDAEFQLQIALPGIDAKDIRLAAFPDSLIVEGESVHQHKSARGDVRVCEFGERKVFRQILLPEPVDIDRVSATLDKGLLEIHATKADRHGSRRAAA